MRAKRWILVLVLVTATFSANSLAAQEPSRPLVLFIIDEALQNASVRDPGPYGLNQLEQVFISLGARTDFAALQTPLPEAADVVVLAGPKRRLPGPYLANLWIHLSRGNHLLLALDPPGQFGISTELSYGALAQLLDADFGIVLQDAVVAEPWFSNVTIAEQNTAFSRTYPETTLKHAVVSPLVDYDLPVEVWGARTMAVEPIGIDSHATPLLVTWTAFGETNRQVFAAGDAEPAPVELNPGEDVTGPLVVGALAENVRMGSRVIVLGDSEVVQNGFGLAVNVPPATPLHPGNQLFVERLASWLLDLPPDNPGNLPEGFTGIMLDGQIDDWDTANGSFTTIDGDGDAISPGYDVLRVGLMHDTGYLYLAVETDDPLPSHAGLKLDLGSDSGERSETVIRLDTSAISLQQGRGQRQLVPDGALAIDAVLEARLPLRLFNSNVSIDSLCLTDDVAAEPVIYANCVTPPLELGTELSTIPPVDTRFPGEPLATVLAAEARLRAGPGTDEALIATLMRGQIVMPVGRNQDADWIKVQNASYTGWITTFLVAVNADITSLPVIEAP